MRSPQHNPRALVYPPMSWLCTRQNGLKAVAQQIAALLVECVDEPSYEIRRPTCVMCLLAREPVLCLCSRKRTQGRHCSFRWGKANKQTKHNHIATGTGSSSLSGQHEAPPCLANHVSCKRGPHPRMWTGNPPYELGGGTNCGIVKPHSYPSRRVVENHTQDESTNKCKHFNPKAPRK